MRKILILGIGNPGNVYRHTRHNIGKDFVERIVNLMNGEFRHSVCANKAPWSWITSLDSVHLYQLPDPLSRVFLGVSHSFMNCSGRSAKAALAYLGKDTQLLVVHDSLDHRLGKVGFAHGKSHRGHNGLRSIIAHTNPDFHRLRFGIGRPELREDVSDYVLGKFTDEEQNLMDISMEKGLELLTSFLKEFQTKE